jgi:hypothetical protein
VRHDALRKRFSKARTCPAHGTLLRRTSAPTRVQHTIRHVRHKSRGPGLVKVRGLPLLRRRYVELWQAADYRWRELFESADVMSEGATRDEPSGPVYYGSTSVLLPLSRRGMQLSPAELEHVQHIIAGDPHARLRAVRIACLEAQLRSGGPIGRVRAELFVRPDPRGVRLDIEVEARVFDERSTRTSG